MDLTAIIILVAAGVLFVLAEIFIPGGVVGSIGLLLLLIGIIAGFNHTPFLGLGLLVGALFFGTVAFSLWMKFMGHSPFGRKIIHQGDAGTWHSFDSESSALTGKQGVAKTILRPGGIATIDGKRVDVVTRGEGIAAGTNIRVLKVEGNRVVVTAAQEQQGQ